MVLVRRLQPGPEATTPGHCKAPRSRELAIHQSAEAFESTAPVHNPKIETLIALRPQPRSALRCQSRASRACRRRGCKGLSIKGEGVVLGSVSWVVMALPEVGIVGSMIWGPEVQNACHGSILTCEVFGAPKCYLLRFLAHVTRPRKMYAPFENQWAITCTRHMPERPLLRRHRRAQRQH